MKIITLTFSTRWTIWGPWSTFSKRSAAFSDYELVIVPFVLPYQVAMENNLHFLFSSASVSGQHKFCQLPFASADFPLLASFGRHLFTTLIIRFKAAQEWISDSISHELLHGSVQVHKFHFVYGRGDKQTEMAWARAALRSVFWGLGSRIPALSSEFWGLSTVLCVCLLGHARTQAAQVLWWVPIKRGARLYKDALKSCLALCLCREVA